MKRFSVFRRAWGMLEMRNVRHETTQSLIIQFNLAKQGECFHDPNKPAPTYDELNLGDCPSNF